MVFMRLTAWVTIFLPQRTPAEKIFFPSPLKCPIHNPLVFINITTKQSVVVQQTVELGLALYQEIACHLHRKDGY